MLSISAREDRSTGSTGNSDDQCIKEICCQGDLVYALVNTSCLCPPEGNISSAQMALFHNCIKIHTKSMQVYGSVASTMLYINPLNSPHPMYCLKVTYSEGSPYTEKYAVTTEVTEDVTVTEETTTIEMTTTEGITTPMSIEGMTTYIETTTIETTTIEMTTTEAITFPIDIAEQVAANGPIKEDVISKVDGMENAAVKRDKDDSSDESSDSESEEDESDKSEEDDVTDDASSGNYSMANDTEGTQGI